MREPARPPLGVDEVGDVRVLARKRAHHRAAAGAHAGHGVRHLVPQVHERHRTRCDAAGGIGRRGARAQRREVDADAAALLHRQRRLAQRGEDAVERVLDRAHHEAVEQRHAARGACTGEDPTTGQEPEVVEHLAEATCPVPAVAGFRRGERTRDPVERRVDRRLGGARRRHEPVTLRPDRPRERVLELRAHWTTLRANALWGKFALGAALRAHWTTLRANALRGGFALGAALRAHRGLARGAVSLGSAL